MRGQVEGRRVSWAPAPGQEWAYIHHQFPYGTGVWVCPLLLLDELPMELERFEPALRQGPMRLPLMTRGQLIAAMEAR